MDLLFHIKDRVLTMSHVILVLFLFALFEYVHSQAYHLYVDENLENLVKVEDDQDCEVIAGGDVVQQMLFHTDPEFVKQLNDDDMVNLISKCRGKRTVPNDIVRQVGFIYPGTKWCGPGNIAAGYNDLGFYKREDLCCREHDHCPQALRSGECKLGLCNDTPYTRSHCDCDERFKQCLQYLSTEVANNIGKLYFNLALVSCFREEHPIIGCLRWNPDGDTCHEYKLDTSRAKEWAFVYSGEYKTLNE